ncbi:hypothetical protein EGI31_19485 [Lacihabitans soyangensis]|uniref:Uncharacterized protein n=2 Tax=Lacihabitans soyangensis TaxID=869394 RepID=A0AAE3H559_9BACT|nr:hypothetical protein [Lacihabitans soyangensis]
MIMKDAVGSLIGSLPVALIMGWLGNMIFKRVEKIFESSTDHEIRLQVMKEQIRVLEEKIKELNAKVNDR